MEPPTPPAKFPSVDLEALETNPKPLFIIRVGTNALAFDLLYANEAFRQRDLREVVLASGKEALLFRSWTQAFGQPVKPTYEFAERTWSAEVVGDRIKMKVVWATGFLSEEKSAQDAYGPRRSLDGVPDPLKSTRSPIYTRSKEDFMKRADNDGAAFLQRMPRTNLNAHWEGIQTMMEMSDVGVFEYNTEGKLLHANEAWYRLRYGFPVYGVQYTD